MITCSRFRWHFWKFQENSMTLLDTFFLKSSPHLALVDELSLDFLAEFSSQTPATLSRQIWSKTAGSSSSSFGFQFQWYLFFCVANSTQNLGAIKPRWVSYISAPIPSTQNLVGGQYMPRLNSTAKYFCCRHIDRLFPSQTRLRKIQHNLFSGKISQNIEMLTWNVLSTGGKC